MIKASDLTDIGQLIKPHGIKGEISATLDYDLQPRALRCIVLDIDGIFVPFFIESFRRRGAESWLLKIDGIENEIQAADLSNHEIYGITAELPIEDEESDGVHLYDLPGFELFDNETKIGVIDAIEDSTANILMIVKNPDGKIIYIPFAEEFITDLDPDKKTISMSLPDGIIDLN